jgi:YHS domain-containing protein
MYRLTALLILAAAMLAGCPDKAANRAENHEGHKNHTGHADGPSGGNQAAGMPGMNHAERDHKMPGHGSDDPPPRPGYPPIDDPDFRWDLISTPKPDHELIDLKNEKDPVTLEPSKDVTLEYKGYLVHFESESAKAKFEKKPIKFLNSLSLEPRVDGSVFLVDVSDYQDAVTEFCPFMPDSEVDPHGSVYILHRGWKFYFCCWTGCGDYFMKNPAAAYGYYGLVERDGKLVKKEE